MPEPTDIPTEVFPEPTFDEMVDSVRPADVSVDEWRDESAEAIVQLSEPQPEFKSSLLLTLLSLVLCYAWLSNNFGWQVTPFILLIITIHELGHFFTMKLFGYRELQLLFIPFVGGLVVGKKSNATQTESAVIALAGPLPSLFIASLGIIGVFCGWYTLTSDLVYRILLLTVLFNGFNMIPIQPLDGGRFFHTLFFSRNPWADVACKVLSAAAFTFLAVQMNYIFGIFVFLILSTLPTTFKMAKLSQRLRETGLNQDSSLEAMPIDRLLKAYVLSRELAQQSQGGGLELNVRYRTGLLSRAYPAAAARRASGLAVGVLLLSYLLTAGLGIAAWREHTLAVSLQQKLKQQQTELLEGDDESGDDGPRVKVIK